MNHKDKFKKPSQKSTGETTGTQDLKEGPGFAGRQQGGEHYGDPKTDVFAFCEANEIGMVAATAVKYNARLGKKGDRDQWILDAKKAIQCTERRCLDLGISLEELYG